MHLSSKNSFKVSEILVLCQDTQVNELVLLFQSLELFKRQKVTTSDKNLILSLPSCEEACIIYLPISHLLFKSICQIHLKLRGKTTQDTEFYQVSQETPHQHVANQKTDTKNSRQEKIQVQNVQINQTQLNSHNNVTCSQQMVERLKCGILSTSLWLGRD